MTLHPVFHDWKKRNAEIRCLFEALQNMYLTMLC